MAQRMESVASPGGVMLSESTARLVDGEAVLGDPGENAWLRGAHEVGRGDAMTAFILYR
jgi:class 3 adenylate cyclase